MIYLAAGLLAWLLLGFVAWALCAMAGRADDDDGWRNGHA